jgi:hypothetical protein
LIIQHNFLELLIYLNFFLDLSRPEEFNVLLTRKEELDFSILQQSAQYEGFSPNSSTITNCWKIVKDGYSAEQKRHFLC